MREGEREGERARARAREGNRGRRERERESKRGRENERKREMDRASERGGVERYLSLVFQRERRTDIFVICCYSSLFVVIYATFCALAI